MKAFALGLFLSTGFSAIVLAPVVQATLQESTLRQCYKHDWPANQAEAHIEFCQEYLANN
jgi:hypothetical protein